MSHFGARWAATKVAAVTVSGNHPMVTHERTAAVARRAGAVALASVVAPSTATAQTITITSSNGYTVGGLADRCQGTYLVQFTTTANPNGSAPDGSWTTVAAMALGAATGGYSPSVRHEFTITEANGRPISGVTGIRVWTGAQFSLAIDELSVFRQVYRTNGSGSLLSNGSVALVGSGATFDISGTGLAAAVALRRRRQT